MLLRFFGSASLSPGLGACLWAYPSPPVCPGRRCHLNLQRFCGCGSYRLFRSPDKSIANVPGLPDPLSLDGRGRAMCFAKGESSLWGNYSLT
ncbi:hypothetical protein F4811DRAFT_547716 [Daldinia bambusicola]|nr:hypothetical protein F4811DRAFT_547716 [Daldinia bambusicola]